MPVMRLLSGENCFLIEQPEGFETRGGEGARMRMTTIGTDGSKTLTDTVFL